MMAFTIVLTSTNASRPTSLGVAIKAIPEPDAGAFGLSWDSESAATAAKNKNKRQHGSSLIPLRRMPPT